MRLMSLSRNEDQDGCGSKQDRGSNGSSKEEMRGE